MAKFELQQGEHVLKEERVTYLKGTLQVQMGTLHLSNKRFVFEKSMNFTFGLIGLLFKSMRGGVVIDVPIEQIQKYSQTKYGLNKNVLVLTTTANQEYEIILKSDYQQWENMLSTLVKKR